MQLIAKKGGPVKASRLKREKKNKTRNVYDTDAILSTDFPVFHEDRSGHDVGDVDAPIMQTVIVTYRLT